MEDVQDCTPVLPDTASGNGDAEKEESQPLEKNNCWGKLISIKSTLESKELTDDCYSVGRAPTCDVILNKGNIGDNYFSQISKVHFKLYRGDLGEHTGLIYLEDVSSNGTFINDKKVGKNKKIILTSADEISLAHPKNKVYFFVNMSIDKDRWLPTTIGNNFIVLKHLGTGGFGDVKLVMNKKSFQHCAIKKLPKELDDNTKIFNEINILKRINHPCVVRLEDVVETQESVCIFLEYMPNGNLLKKIVSKKKLSETQTKVIFYQLMLAVEYLHEEGITHRDLKPENILLSSCVSLCTESEPISLIKVTDFGLSKVINSQTKMKTACGTLQYAAPEVVFAKYIGPYSKKVDIWSLGVILYVCLTGMLLFDEEDIRGLYDPLQVSRKINENLHNSLCAKDIISKMIKVKASLRINTPEIFNHPWLQDRQMIEKVNSVLNVQRVKGNNVKKRETDFDLFLTTKKEKVTSS
ncbi:ovarian-specific serine/threonine-protein kinase Lok [Cimex lectularius]|uniref:Uncharacterized protein n=1 Tax=Cimex lectularius TaxID=79782 RepID=A0A8I6RMN1_CIMLE|nr:ovarian-specific serine/threonine-protein kinase Lok [Cimex lectularius]